MVRSATSPKSAPSKNVSATTAAYQATNPPNVQNLNRTLKSSATTVVVSVTFKVTVPSKPKVPVVTTALKQATFPETVPSLNKRMPSTDLNDHSTQEAPTTRQLLATSAVVQTISLVTVKLAS